MPDLDQQYQTAEQEWQQAEQGEQDYQSEIETARNEGRFTAVAEELKTVNPTAHQEITSALGYLDAAMTPEQSKVLVREITKGNPRESMVALHRLTMPTVQDDGSTVTPAAKLEYLASLPPDQLETILRQSRLNPDGARHFHAALPPICRPATPRFQSTTTVPRSTRRSNPAAKPERLSKQEQRHPSDYVRVRASNN